MLSRHMLAELALGGLIMVGCEKKAETTAHPPRNDSMTPAPAPAPSAAAGRATGGGSNVGTGNATAAGAGQAVGDSAAGAKDATAGMAAAPNETAGGSREKAKAALGGEDPQSMVDKAMEYIKDNKLDDAQTLVDKLDSVRGSLPADWA